MKGLVLAGGTGSRLRPITFSLAKQLVPIANRPIIEYGLTDMVAAGITHIGIVVSPETGHMVQSVVSAAADRIGFTPTFIVQDEPLGLAHALKVSLPFIDGDDCLMYLGDNLVKNGVTDVVTDFEANRPHCQIMLSPVENPSAFGVVDLAPDGTIRRLLEKPSDPPSNLALVGVYLFDSTIAGAVEAISPSARGELEITDAIQYLVESTGNVRASIVSGWWKDTGTKEDLLTAQELVMAELEDRVEGELIGTEVRGPLQVGSGSRLIDCHITGPVVIGSGTHVTRATVGPYTAIGDRCHVTDASVESSIVMDDSTVNGWKISASLLGRAVRVHGSGPTTLTEMTLGDRSEVLGE